MKAIKGFDAKLQCWGFQFVLGQTYRHEGKVRACQGGFHAIPENAHPLSVFEYYPPAGSRFCIVEVDGATDTEGNKIAAEILTVGKEIGLGDLATEAVAWVMARAKPEGKTAVKDNGLATASGTQGAATASGTQGSNAMATGFGGNVRGVESAGLYAVERETWDGPIVSNACGVVGRDGIKADTWYHCKGGKLVECAE